MRNSWGLYIAVGFIAILVAAGFYFVLEKFSALQENFKNFELSFELYKKERAVLPVSLPVTQPIDEEVKRFEPPPTQESLIIPTAILFQAKSNASSEQVNLNVSVESITRTSNGTIEVALKVFNGNGQNYAQLDPLPLFEIIDLQNPDASQQPYKIEGAYDAIPPKGAVLGKIFFKISALTNTIILRIGSLEAASFYEFNFQKKTYKEVTVG